MSDNYQATFAPPLTRAELEADNPYTPQFEFLQESDESLGIKVGPGYWNDLPYLANSGVKRYQAVITQLGTAAPVATVLENTLGGTPVWARTTTGTFTCTLADAFPGSSRTQIVCDKAFCVADDLATLYLLYAQISSTDELLIVTGQVGAPEDGVLSQLLTGYLFTVIVYPA